MLHDENNKWGLGIPTLQEVEKLKIKIVSHVVKGNQHENDEYIMEYSFVVVEDIIEVSMDHLFFNRIY